MKRLVYLPLLLILLVSWISGVLPFGQPAMVYAQSTLTLYPNAVTTTVYVDSTDIDWANPTNVFAADDAHAEIADIDGDLYTYRLEATDFRFEIPANSTIDGIEVEYERYSDVVEVVDDLVVLIKEGIPQGTNRSTGAGWPQSDAITTFGTSIDKWGEESWTVADIENTGFGVAVAAMTTKNNCQAYIDFLRITVYYTLPPPDISNTPSSWAFGAVDPSMEYTTDITYVEGVSGFRITNNSGYAINITISATDMGTGWLLADDGIPLATYYALWAGTEDTGGAYSIMVTSTGEPLTTVAAPVGSTKDWGLKLMTPLSFGDGGSKSGTVTLTATEA